MNFLVVSESFYGNTTRIARAIADALAERGDVLFTSSSNLECLKAERFDLLVLGCPTRAFGPTPGIKRFLRTFRKLPDKALVFDTRMDHDNAPGFLRPLMKTFGYAAEKLARKVAGKGSVMVLPPESFVVTDPEGPLAEGEEQRARAWVLKALSQIES